jgi:hypothetical protein
MGGSRTTNTTRTTIPAEIRERGTQITNAAMGNYFDPGQNYQPYSYANHAQVGQDTTGQLNSFHGQAGQQTGQAGNQFNQASMSYQPYYNMAGSALASGVGSQANQFSGQTGTANQLNTNTNVNQALSGPTNTAQNISNPEFNQQNLERFFNPYQGAVIDQGVRRIQDEMTQGRLANQSRAASAGAFGGTRHAILDAENQNNAMTNLSDFVGSQLSQGYGQAVNQFNTDYGQRLQALGANNQAAGQNFNQGLAQNDQNNRAYQANLQNQMTLNQQNNQTAGQNFNQSLAALQLNNQAAGQNFNQSLSSANFLQGLGTANQQAGINAGDAMLRGANASTQLGNVITAQDQAQRDNAYERGYLDERNYPMEIYERLSAINAMQPVNRTSTSTQSTSGGWLGPALGAAGAIMGSDINMKENVSERDPEEVLGAFADVRPYEYTYKDSAREAHPDITKPGVRRGFMAQDYERAHGRATGPTTSDGFKTVDMGNVLGDLVAAVHGLEKRTRALKPKAKRGA